ncbi:hypothetical protein CONLIGDRAFT_645885 [Coniochaeta ligniaria NRRL 30616]|uniref:RGS domain-containing protein n=1 Tax=Coniochaeta ligniaria NRRL 30616 TaxID=1408157 RepID=A0A1J7IJS4_9PEZI|nr:hypothetical protein CONLIGDRAFT_645885 [Coniochaeta ligniaria NRRL 30616]
MRLPSWLTWYKKPEYRDIKQYSAEVRSGRRQLSPDGRGKTAIPSRLKLERILQNKTCSPMSLYDFYMYLKYIEFSAENLEFYIWFKNYETDYLKMGSDRDDNSLHSAPESTSSTAQLGEKPPHIVVSEFSVDPEVGKTLILHLTDPGRHRLTSATAKDTIDRITQMISSEAICSMGKCSPSVGDRVRSFIKPDSTALPAQPEPAKTQGSGISTLNLTRAPPGHRTELNAVIETFLLPGSEKELNIPPSLRDQALLALQSSPDPSHLRPIADHVYGLLRNCSHRNFVRLGVSNGTYETVCVATGLGIVLTAAGFLTALLRAFVPFAGAHARWDAFAAWPLWWLGVSLILSGLRGSCFFLLLFSRRQPLPWERFDDGASVLSQKSGIVRVLSRLMIFDRKFKVQDAHLRRLQRKIVVQSLIGGAVFANLSVLLFVFLPVWRETVRG